MRSQSGKKLRSEFEKRMESHLPLFVREHDVVVPQGFYVWAWSMGKEARAFLTFQINDKNDSFTIGVAWSSKGNYPNVVFTYPNEPTEDGETNFRLGHLFGSRQDYWWYLARVMSISEDFFEFEEDPIEMALSRIDPCLDDAFEKIESYELPYFETMKSRA